MDMIRMVTVTREEGGLVVLSTEAPCPQDGLSLLAQGWDLSRFSDTVKPKGFYNHAAHGPDDLPILVWDDMQVRDGKLMGRPRFASGEYEKAAVIERLWEGGFLDDVSVSFRVDGTMLSDPITENGITYQKSGRHTLIECSVVAVGADQNAGKGRALVAQAVAENWITDKDAMLLYPDWTPRADSDERAAHDDEVNTLRAALEAAREEIDRLKAAPAERIPPVRIVKAPPQLDNQRFIVTRTALEAAVQTRVMATLAAVFEKRLRVERGKLPD